MKIKLLEIVLWSVFASFVILSIFVTTCKSILSDNGYKVSFFGGAINDIRQIKKLSKEKRKYKYLYPGLLLSIILFFSSLLLMIILLFSHYY